jgi:hypothetical protein
MIENSKKRYSHRVIPRQLGEGGEKKGEPELTFLLRKLKENPEEGVYEVLLDRTLYLAATLWYREDRKGLFRALETTPVFARRIIGYGLYLLGGGEGDPLPAWEPFGVWILTREPGWNSFLGTLTLSQKEWEAMEELKRTIFPWGRRYAILAYLASLPRYREISELLKLAVRKGGLWTRLLARGTLKLHGNTFP